MTWLVNMLGVGRHQDVNLVDSSSRTKHSAPLQEWKVEVVPPWVFRGPHAGQAEQPREVRQAEQPAPIP